MLGHAFQICLEEGGSGLVEPTVTIVILHITKKPSQQGLHNEQAPGQRYALSKNDLRVTSE